MNQISLDGAVFSDHNRRRDGVILLNLRGWDDAHLLCASLRMYLL